MNKMKQENPHNNRQIRYNNNIEYNHNNTNDTTPKYYPHIKYFPFKNVCMYVNYSIS